MMTADQTRLFEQACAIWEAGERTAAVRLVREVSETVADAEDRAGLLYHEVIWLLALPDLRRARAQLDVFKVLVRSITTVPSDSDQLSPGVTLTVMACFAEAKVLIDEGRGIEALRIFEDLESQYPNQISLPPFDDIRSQMPILRGMILANLNKWSDARPLLEKSPSPPGWEGLVAYYLGHLYYESNEFPASRQKLREAIGLHMERKWESRAHYILGLTEYQLSNMIGAKKEFELCAGMADPEYLETTNIWNYLESVSEALGEYVDAKEWRKRWNAPPSHKVN
jgi:tetratricopeptide (TPR) repeat protein